MWEVLKAILVVSLCFAALLAFLGILYWLTTLLPSKWQESWRAWVFLLPAMVALLAGLLIPAIRTVYLSFFNDSGQSFVGFRPRCDVVLEVGPHDA